MWDEKPEVDGAQPRRTVERDRAHLGVVDQGGDEEEGWGGEGRDHTRPVRGNAAASDEDVAGAEEHRRGTVQRSVDRGKPGRPISVPSARHVDEEGAAPEDDGGQRADDPGSEPLGRGRRFGLAGGEESGLCHEQRGNLDLAWTRCPRGAPSRGSCRPQSQPAAQLRPEKLQRSARKRSHSTNTRTVPTPRTATFLTHRL